jgi:hypothetical protein
MILNMDNILEFIDQEKSNTFYKSTLKQEMLKIKNSAISHDDIKRILKLHNYPGAGISGSLIPKNKIAEYIITEDDSYEKDGILKYLFNKKDLIDHERVKEIIEPIDNKNNRVI